jgi:hypothetical protein
MNIKYSFFIGAVKLFKVCGGNVAWPIIARLVNLPDLDQFVVGIYTGTENPETCKEYLQDFVAELKQLTTKGIFIPLFKKKISIQLHSIICNTEIHSFLTATRAYACQMCVQKDFKASANKEQPLRTDTDFRNKLDKTYHAERDSPLLEIPSLKMVTHFPLDYQSVVCTGVMRLMLLCFIKGINKSKLSPKKLDKIDIQLQTLVAFVPLDFAKPRLLRDLLHWDAQHLDEFLRFFGPYVLTDILPPAQVAHFYLLHFAIRILHSETLIKGELIHYARTWLKTFVNDFSKFYLKDDSKNVHRLLHLCSIAEKYGPLSNVSGLKYASKLKEVYQLLNNPNTSLTQAVQYMEETRHEVKHSCDFLCVAASHHVPMPKGFKLPIFSQIQHPDFTITNRPPDNCVVLTSGEIVVINFMGSFNKEITIQGQKFLKVEPFCNIGTVESSELGIYKARDLSKNQDEKWCISKIKCKAVMIPLKSTTDAFYIAEMKSRCPTANRTRFDYSCAKDK